MLCRQTLLNFHTHVIFFSLTSLLKKKSLTLHFSFPTRFHAKSFDHFFFLWHSKVWENPNCCFTLTPPALCVCVHACVWEGGRVCVCVCLHCDPFNPDSPMSFKPQSRLSLMSFFSLPASPCSVSLPLSKPSLINYKHCCLLMMACVRVWVHSCAHTA